MTLLGLPMMVRGWEGAGWRQGGREGVGWREVE